MTLLTIFICDENNILLKQESQVMGWGRGVGRVDSGRTLHSHLLYGTPKLIKTSDIRLYYIRLYYLGA